MTFSSSLPICAVSPAEALRSLTMPSNGARTSVRCNCCRACTTRALAADRSLCVVLRWISASSSCWADTMPDARSVLSRWNWRSAWSNARVAARSASCGREQAVADGGVVQAHQQVALAHGLAVFLEHREHHGRDFGAQVGAAVGLDGSGDERAAAQGGRADLDDVLRVRSAALRRRPSWHWPASGRNRPARRMQMTSKKQQPHCGISGQRSKPGTGGRLWQPPRKRFVLCPPTAEPLSGCDELQERATGCRRSGRKAAGSAPGTLMAARPVSGQ